RGEQDQRALRRQAEGEGDGDQQRHAVDRAEARQQADNGADQGAAQGGEQIVGAQGDAEALAEVAQGFHGSDLQGGQDAQRKRYVEDFVEQQVEADRNGGAGNQAGTPAAVIKARHRDAGQDAGRNEAQGLEQGGVDHQYQYATGDLAQYMATLGSS